VARARESIGYGVALAALLLATGAAKASTDYRLDSRDWNGLSRLSEEARAVGCDIRADELLDWSTLDARDVLWFVYPRSALDGQRLSRYLSAGGRALIADDFGAADRALAALGIRRLQGTLPDVERYADNPALPLARARLSTELSQGVPALVANHPAFFSSPVPPTYAFAPGAALVVEGRLGRGYFVALADPSVLINNMLEMEDDRAFARALVKRTCRAGERLHLYTQTFATRGDPPRELAGLDEGPGPFPAFNRMLTGLDDVAQAAALDGRLLAGLAILGALGAIAWAARTWPSRDRIDGEWVRAPEPRDSSWQAQVDRFHRDPRLGYALPAVVLREEAIARLSETLGGA
jgi:hypothetical protein